MVLDETDYSVGGRIFVSYRRICYGVLTGSALF